MLGVGIGSRHKNAFDVGAGHTNGAGMQFIMAALVLGGVVVVAEFSIIVMACMSRKATGDRQPLL